MRRDCLCGHPESEHKWSAAECGHSGCSCNVYRVGRVARFPKAKYVLIESDEYWDLYTTEDESFS